MLLLAALALVASGCTTSWHAIVVRDGAPLYADDDRERVIGHLDRLDHATLGRFRPDGDPVAVKTGGRRGFANRSDLRVFSVDRDRDDVREVVFRVRRDVDLEGRDWPQSVKRAIRQDRVERGMTREQVELAWGRPSSARSLPEGGERWDFERAVLDITDHVDWTRYPGGSAFHAGYGWGGWGWGYGGRRGWYGGPAFGWTYTWPAWETVRTRVVHESTVRRSVTFDAEGRVVGFDARER
jgi:hypothetical protein